MNFLIFIVIIFVNSVDCDKESRIESRKSLRNDEPEFDNIPDLSTDCKTKARNESILCELKACNKFGCVNCECTDQTDGNYCKSYWDGACCYINVVDELCSEVDLKRVELYIALKAVELENTTCKDTPKHSYDCNGYEPIFDQIGGLSQNCKLEARNKSIACELNACNKFGCDGCKCANTTDEKFCKSHWDGACCYSDVIGGLCSEVDHKTVELYVAKIAEVLQSNICKEWPKNSYDCNVDIGYEPIFDQIDGISENCKLKARNKSIECELNACDKFDCPGCKCDTTEEKFCKTHWDGACCYETVLNDLCSESDQKNVELYISSKAEELESEECKDWPRSSYSCKISSGNNKKSIKLFSLIIVVMIIKYLI
jgi:hypothetical protein